MFAEAYGGAIAGGMAAAIFFGINPLYLAGFALGPAMLPISEALLLESANGLLLVAGLNVGLVAGAGVGGFVGGIF